MINLRFLLFPYLAQKLTMPGFLLSTTEHNEDFVQAIPRLEGFTTKAIHQDAFCSLSNFAHPSYPSQKFVFKNVTVLFEGCVYNQSNPDLASVFSTFFSANEVFTEKISSWVQSADGEFVLLILHHGLREILIVNDSWGRLPVYYFKEKNAVVVSREIGFITRMKSNLQANRTAIAMYLIFGYPLACDTLWEGIYRLPPHGFFRIDLRSKTYKLTEKFEFPAYQHHTNADNGEVDALFDVLKSATLSRARAHQGMALSLSGGLDSRVLAGILSQHLSTSRFITYQDPNGSALQDIIAVQQIIEQLDITDRHHFVHLQRTGHHEMALLLQIKQGLNYLGMAFLIPYLKYLRQEAGTQMTGDGGDKLLADIRPLYTVKSEKQLLRYLLRSNGLMTTSQVHKLTGIKPTDLSEYIINHLRSYGGSSMEDVHARFLILERGMNWLFEGEDRNRYFGWCTSPYYHPELARRALRMHPEQKAAGQLFLSLFSKLPGHLSQITNPNWKLPPANTAAIKKMLWRQSIKMRLPASFFQWQNRSGQQANAFLEEALLRQPKKGTLPDWFNNEALQEMSTLNTDAKWNLLSLRKMWEMDP